MAKNSGFTYTNPDVVLYMILDFVGSSCYNSIINNEPLPINEYKPYLFQSIRAILQSQNNI